MKTTLTERVKALALEEGFDLAGVTGPGIAADDRENIAAFAAGGLFGTMDWFARHNDIRLDPRSIFPEAESVLLLAVVYRDADFDAALRGAGRKVARYAAGRDYHKLIRKKGKRLLARIRAIAPEARGRIAVDSAPVPEKVLARQAGLGWQGKHTNLIHPELGSYFFLAALFLNLPLEVDRPIADLCGRCRLCIDACPTQALGEYRIDPRRCISYLTIEHRGSIPGEFRGRLGGWVFGCDICQEVCPYNRSPRGRSSQTREAGFRPRPEVLAVLAGRAIDDETAWSALRTGSPLGRIDRAKWLDNQAASGSPEIENQK